MSYFEDRMILIRQLRAIRSKAIAYADFPPCRDIAHWAEEALRAVNEFRPEPTREPDTLLAMARQDEMLLRGMDD